MFNDKSRYYEEAPYAVTDRRGRTVLVVGVPPSPLQSLAGYHIKKQWQRLDNLAAIYTNTSTGFWKIAEMNDAMLSEATYCLKEIAIPSR
jgi:hypothetical protein